MNIYRDQIKKLAFKPWYTKTLLNGILESAKQK